MLYNVPKCLLPLAVALTIGFGCSDNSNQTDMSELFGGEAAEENKDEQALDEEDQAEALILPDGRLHLKVKRAAFEDGVEFLLSASVIPQVQAATSTALMGRVIQFKYYADGVDIYESNKGRVVTGDLPASSLLATFPIVSENDEQVVIDFNAGIKEVFTDAWTGSPGSNTFDGTTGNNAFTVRNARVFEVNADKSRLMIRQSVRVQVALPSSSIFSSSANPGKSEVNEVRYYLSRYEPSDFKSKALSDFQHVGYFGTYPLIEDESGVGRAVANTLRFDIRKPVKFYYSSNTPKEYVDAVKDGILYWNKAFGKEVIFAEAAPEGVTAPDPDYNIVQWVPYDTAGFAYADVIPDPVNGEALHAQVYMTSVFAFVSKSRARALLRLLQTAAEEPDASFELGLNFMKPVISCYKNKRETALEMADMIENLLADKDVTDAKVLRASQDYVRNVIAHEVGHVLGLRHNFAASLETNMTEQELSDWNKKYMTEDEVPSLEGKVVASSVMDYNARSSNYALGYQIRANEDAMPYDKAAIEWGYYDNNDVEDNKMVFCTDSDTTTYLDCKRFDSGADPIVGKYNEISKSLNQLPNYLIEKFISAKAPFDARDKKDLREVNLVVSTKVKEVGTAYADMLKWFNSSTRSWKIEHTLDFVGELNVDKLNNLRWENLQAQYEKLGGIETAAFKFLPVKVNVGGSSPQGAVEAEKFDAKAMTAKVGELLDSEVYGEFVGADGESYSFTDEEKSLIKQRAADYFKLYEKELLKAVFSALAKNKPNLGFAATGYTSDDDVVTKLESAIIKVVKDVVTTVSDKERRVTHGQTNYVVKEYKYDLETRVAACGALTSSAGAYAKWSTAAKSSSKSTLKSKFSGELNGLDVDKMSSMTLSRTLDQWYQEYKKVSNAL